MVDLIYAVAPWAALAIAAANWRAVVWLAKTLRPTTRDLQEKQR